MKYIFGLVLALFPQENPLTSIVDFAGSYPYQVSIPFPGDTIVHIPDVDLAVELSLGTPDRVISDERGESRIYYYQGWRISYHQILGQRHRTTISRM